MVNSRSTNNKDNTFVTILSEDHNTATMYKLVKCLVKKSQKIVKNIHPSLSKTNLMS